MEKNILPNVFFLGLFFKLSPSRVVFGRFFPKSPLRALFLGGFFSKSPFRALFFGDFFPNHPFARCFWEVFSQITPSRVVSRGVFLEITPSRVVSLRFFFKNSIPMCLEMLFSLGACCSFGCEKRQGHRDLFFLCGLFQSFASQLFSHVACFHIHVIDVFFAIVAARRAFATQHQRVGA